MSVNCDAIVIFLIYGQFGDIRKLSSGRKVCKIYIFWKSNPLSYQNFLINQPINHLFSKTKS